MKEITSAFVFTFKFICIGYSGELSAPPSFVPDNTKSSAGQDRVSLQSRETSGKNRIGAYRNFETTPPLRDVLRNSKPANTSLINTLLLKKDVIHIGAARIDILRDRLSNKQKYIWSSFYRRYKKPEFVVTGNRKIIC